MVFAGGSQLLVRSWDGDIHWGGRSGTVAAMNSDGTRVISALDASVRVLDKNGEEVWTRILGSVSDTVRLLYPGTVHLFLARMMRGISRRGI